MQSLTKDEKEDQLGASEHKEWHDSDFSECSFKHPSLKLEKLVTHKYHKCRKRKQTNKETKKKCNRSLLPPAKGPGKREHSKRENI